MPFVRTTLVLAARVVVSARTAAQTRGTLFIVGGGPQPPELVQEFVNLAGGAGRAHIIVFAMASSEGLPAAK